MRHKYLSGEIKKVNNPITPMLAKEIDEPFDDKGWIYEIKWDGYRAIAEVNKKNVKLYSRSGNTFLNSYPIVVSELKKINIQAILDGEIVVVDENRKSNFQFLQQYLNGKQYPIEYRVFDVLSINGQNTCDLPLIERKKLLKQLLPKNDVVKYSGHIKNKGIAFFNSALKNDLEGIMAKKANSLYLPGVRTSDWLKMKHHKSLEAVIAGFTEPTGSRKNFGALVLGMWHGKILKYVGHTGSGFDAKGLIEMSQLLKPLIQPKSPFNEKVKTNTPATWVKPVLVAEIKYTERTTEGHLRHPIFLRLRKDKKSKQITSSSIEPVVTKQAMKKSATKKIKVASKKEILSSNKKDTELVFGKIKVKTTHLNKVFWPEEKITKGDVINYYQSISEYILPYLKNRPQSLKRNPNGIKEFGFFQKDAGIEAPAWVKSKSLYSESANKDIAYILCNDAATLAYLNNLGCIEINPWHSTAQNIDKPDYMIIDLDPAKKNTFNQVIEAANITHSILQKIGAPSYCKTSGATGLHIYVPTQKKYTYNQLKDFAHLICIKVQEQLPNSTSLIRNLKQRGDKMIYLDHLQNRRGQTISSVFSLRPTKEATVSMPLNWREVKPGLSPQDFTIHNALKEIKKRKSIFTPVLGKGINLIKCLKLLDK